ncbi:AMP-binding protein, partial [Mucilaginibacter sp. RCC_168]|uniref:AMP-binding protein n=1 Tax=Mucilaginibacter sp. RCC_168 TaxID=3239221 RepID=UPI0035232E7E
MIVEHRNVVSLVRDTNYTTITAGDKILQLSNYGFDGSVFDIFGSVLNGACIYMIDKTRLLSGTRLIDFIATHEVNIMFITTALLNNFIDIGPAFLKHFDKIYFGGENASIPRIRAALPFRKTSESLVHVYGPTEATTFSTYYVIKDEIPHNWPSIPIGVPLTHRQVYVLDTNRCLCPVGVSGELYIGGSG